MIPRRKKRFFFIVGLLASLGILLLACCLYFRIGSKQDAIAYYCMWREHFHPVWKALALRRFGRGDALKKLTDAYPPVRVEDFSPYKALRYDDVGSFNGLLVLAKGGVLVAASAVSCTWEHDFFRMTRAEEAAADQAYNRYIRGRLVAVGARKIIEAFWERRTVVIGGFQGDAGSREAPLVVKVLEAVSGPMRAGEEISVPPGKRFIDPRHVQDGKLVVIAGRDGYYESVSFESLQEAKKSLSAASF